MRFLRSIFLGLFAAGDFIKPDLVESEMQNLPLNKALMQTPVGHLTSAFAVHDLSRVLHSYSLAVTSWLFGG